MSVSNKSIDLIENALEISVPRVIIYIFLLFMETIVIFIIDNIFNTCTKKKSKVNYSINNYSSFSSNITTINLDSLGKDFDKNTDTETLRKRISVLQTEHSKNDCPSTFAYAAKIYREINRLKQILESRDLGEDGEVKGEYLSSLFSSSTYVKDFFTINTFARIVFRIINYSFLFVCRDLTLYIQNNTLLSKYFNESEYANFLEVRLVYVLFGINLMYHSCIKTVKDVYYLF